MIDLGPGSLLPKVAECSQRAIEAGVLQPISTTEERISDDGVDFSIQVANAPERTNQPHVGPYSPDKAFSANSELYVADISETHYCLLNKFNVLKHHLLIVTRHFEHQEELLKLRDFVALCTCMREFESLAFYNAGITAGASQMHKHLQLVPMRLTNSRIDVPMEALFKTSNGQGARIRNLPDLPFEHAFSWISETIFDDPKRSGEITYDLYVDLLEVLGLRGNRIDGELRQPSPYNLIMTRRWMMLVPRTQGHCESVAINGLGFAGSLFVRDPTAMARIRELGPMQILSRVARPRIT